MLFSGAHLRSNIIELISGATLLNLSRVKNCASARQVCFVYLLLVAHAFLFHSSAALSSAWSVRRASKQLMNCSAWMQTRMNLPRIPTQRFKINAIYATTSTQHDVRTKTFVESADGASRYAPHVMYCVSVFQ